MNTFSNNLQKNLTPAYVEKFDLTLPPFSSQFETALFYENETREIMLKKISHLLDFTHYTLFIQGESGLGKTTLIRQRIHEMKETWRTCFINAKDFTTHDTLITKISSDMKVKFNKKNHIQSLREQLDAMQQTGLTPILFIDDIEEINTAIIPTLSHLIHNTAETSPSLRLVICGRDAPKNLLNAIPKDNEKSTLKYLPLPPLTEIETKDYIEHHLQAVDYSYSEPFNKNQLKNIYLASKGFPLHINTLCDQRFAQYALEYDDNKPLIRLNKNTNRMLKYIASGLSALILLLVALSMFETSNPEAPLEKIKGETQELKIPALEKKPPLVVAEKMSEAPTKKTIQETLKTDKPTKEKQKKEDVVEEPISHIEQKTTATLKTLSASRIWVNKQNPEHYTLQLIGSVNRSAIQQFITQHEIEEHAAIIRRTHKNRAWYSVIYQSYETRQLATQGIKSLPASLKKIKPWIRPFSLIQKTLE